jgi:Tol biopolymer transport system component
MSDGAFIEPGLWLVNVLDGSHRLIGQPPGLDITGAAISPDGQRLAYGSNTWTSHHIWLANADGSEPKLVLDSPTLAGVWGWSPDSQYLLYSGDPPAGESDESAALWIMDREGSNRKPLNAPFIFGYGFEPAWSPVGHQIVSIGVPEANSISCWQKFTQFLADPLCAYRGAMLYVEDVDTGKVQVVAQQALDPSWSPDGRLLAYTALDEREQVDLWLTDVATGEKWRITDSPAFEHAPVWAWQKRQVEADAVPFRVPHPLYIPGVLNESGLATPGA